MNSLIPKISLVLACYNNEETIEKDLDKILRQTMNDFEVIVVDDGSSDGTREIISNCAVRDARIRPFFQENKGLTCALIEGCRHVRGQYIARQDCEDFSTDDRFLLQSNYLDSNLDVGFVSCFATFVGPQNEFLEIVERPTDPEIATRCLLTERLGPPGHGTVMFRRSLYDQVGGYREPFYFAQDSDLWLRMAEKARLGYVAKPCYTVIVNSTGISGTYRQMQKELAVIAHECRAARLKGESETELLEKAYDIRKKIIQERTQATSKDSSPSRTQSQLQFTYMIASTLVKNRDRRAIPYLIRLIRKEPRHIRAWIRLLQIVALRCTGQTRKPAA